MKILYLRWKQSRSWLTARLKREVQLPAWKQTYLFWLLVLAGPLHAAPSKLPQEIDARLREDASQTLHLYLQQQGWTTSKVDYQVWISPAVDHLPPCQQVLRLQVGGQYRQPWGRRPYLVECASPSWQLRARVDITLTLPVWMTAREIRKGQTIQAVDLIEESLDVARLQRGFIPASESLVGSKASRNLRMGQLVGELDLQKVWAVRGGEGVLIRAGQGSFSATTRGTALASGAIGDAIKVRNSNSGKEIQAWVIAKGEVETRF